MPHDVTLIASVAVGFVLAALFGYGASRLGLPPLAGYLLAGVAVGPFTPGFVADAGLAGQLAEIGVILLMFGVGLHFSVADLAAVRRIAIPGAVGQILIATLLGAVMTRTWGWSWGSGVVMGLCLSVASTVVLLKALEERNAVATVDGRIAVGWLIVEDLAMVLVLVLLPAVAPFLGATSPPADGAHAATASHGPGGWVGALALTLLKVGAFAALVLLLGPRTLPWMLRQVARTGSRELFTLSVLAISMGIAFGSAHLFGVSFALGAFFAGVVLSESDLSHKAAGNSLPLQDAFAVLFFVSVGMLFDPGIVLQQPLRVAGVVLLILMGKSLIAVGIVLALGFPARTALNVSAALAQVGEFSFILAGLGVGLGLLPAESVSLLVAGALFSIALNPAVFAATDLAVRCLGRPVGAPDPRRDRLAAVEADLDAARLRAEERVAAHRFLSPEELAERFPVFRDLSQDQRELLLLYFRPRSVQPGERIIRTGDVADAVYFIQSGEVEVQAAGRRIRLGPGSVFGEMGLLGGKLRTADVTALDYCRLLWLGPGDFRYILRKHPDLRRDLESLVGERREMNEHAPAGNDTA
ncbi:MAG: cation:proton antiporter [Verrucomicrobiae bacterium]|nr:cation:proton antiporter [Verrucomicrobiae bacterium]